MELTLPPVGVPEVRVVPAGSHDGSRRDGYSNFADPALEAHEVCTHHRFMYMGLRTGELLELTITGYQFPDAADVGLRYSWHMIRGTATTAAETWEFHWQALTCHESERVTTWLLSAADTAQIATPGQEATLPAALSFTEPNLMFDLEQVDGPDAIRLRVELDLEFRAPSNRRARGAGDPSLLQLTTSAVQLRAAAAAWSVDVARFPDLYPYEERR